MGEREETHIRKRDDSSGGDRELDSFESHLVCANCVLVRVCSLWSLRRDLKSMSDRASPSPQDVYPKMRPGDAGVLYPAAFNAMVMTALADGPLGQNEKDALVEVFYAANRWNMSPQAVLTNLQTLIDALILNKEHWPELFEKARGLSGESKIDILRACAKMAHMDDGQIGPEEQKRIDSIASLIEIESQDLERWNEEYRRVK